MKCKNIWVIHHERTEHCSDTKCLTSIGFLNNEKEWNVFENYFAVQTPVGAIMVTLTPLLLSFQVLLAYLMAGDLPSFIASFISARGEYLHQCFTLWDVNLFSKWVDSKIPHLQAQKILFQSSHCNLVRTPLEVWS